MRIKLLTVALTLTILSLAWPRLARSQSAIDDVGLSIVPAISEKVVVAGQLTLTALNITNITNNPQAVIVSFRPFAPIDPVIDESYRARYDASSWLNTSDKEILLESKESRTIDIEVTPPKDAGPGGHYATVTFRVIGPSIGQTDDTTTVVRPELSSLLLLTVPGDISEVAEASFSVPARLSQNKNRQLSTSLSNIGSVHLLPSVLIDIKNLNNQSVATLKTAPKLVIPGTTSSLESTWSNAPPGIYRAHFRVSYGSPIKQISRTSPLFIVLPSLWIQLIALFSLLFILRFSLPPLVRLFRRRRLKLSQDITGEPDINIHREKIEIAEAMSKLKDNSRKK